MWDHVLFGTAYRVETPTSSELVDDPDYATQATFEYNHNQTGPLTGFGFLAFEKVPQEFRSKFSQAT